MNTLVSVASLASSVAIAAPAVADPILAAIAEHRRLDDAQFEVWAELQALENEPADLIQKHERLSAAAHEAAVSLASVRPTTAAGAGELIDYVLNEVRDHETGAVCIENLTMRADWHLPAIANALRSLGVQPLQSSGLVTDQAVEGNADPIFGAIETYARAKAEVVAALEAATEIERSLGEEWNDHPGVAVTLRAKAMRGRQVLVTTHEQIDSGESCGRPFWCRTEKKRRELHAALDADAARLGAIEQTSGLKAARDRENSAWYELSRLMGVAAATVPTSAAGIAAFVDFMRKEIFDGLRSRGLIIFPDEHVEDCALATLAEATRRLANAGEGGRLTPATGSPLRSIGAGPDAMVDGTIAKQRHGKSQYELYGLPFFSRPDRCTWAVKPTGDYEADHETGADYAAAFLKSCDGTVGWSTLLPQIVGDMIKAGPKATYANGKPKADGIVIGFARTLGEILAFVMASRMGDTA